MLQLADTASDSQVCVLSIPVSQAIFIIAKTIPRAKHSHPLFAGLNIKLQDINKFCIIITIMVTHRDNRIIDC